MGLGGGITNEADAVMRNVGVAVGLAALLKGTGYHAQKCELVLDGSTIFRNALSCGFN